GGVYFHHHWLAMIGQHAAAVVVEHELGIDQFTMILDQPGHSIRRATFLIRRHCENDVTAGYVSFFLHADERSRHDCVAVLHIAGAAPVVVSVLLDELERI